MTHFMILIRIIKKQVLYQFFFKLNALMTNRLTGIVFEINIKNEFLFNLNNTKIILNYQP